MKVGFVNPIVRIVILPVLSGTFALWYFGRFCRWEVLNPAISALAHPSQRLMHTTINTILAEK